LQRLFKGDSSGGQGGQQMAAPSAATTSQASPSEQGLQQASGGSGDVGVTDAQLAEMERALQELQQAQAGQLPSESRETDQAGTGSDPNLYGAATAVAPTPAPLPFRFLLKGDRAAASGERLAEVRPLADDTAAPTTIVNQPTVPLERVTLNPQQQTAAPMTEWALPPEYQDAIRRFYERAEE